MRSPTALASLLLLLLVPARLHAQEAIQLDWVAPPDCPTQSMVLDQVHALLGGTTTSLHSQVTAVAEVSHADDRWILRLTTESDSGGSGTRKLEAQDCEGVAKAAALIVALTYDPVAVANRTDDLTASFPPESTPAPSTPNAPPSAAPSSAGSAPNAPPQPLVPAFVPPSPSTAPSTMKREINPRATPQWSIGFHGEGDAGSLPQIAFGVGAALGASFALGGPWRLRPTLSATYFLPQRATLPGQTFGGDFDFFAAAGSICPEASLRTLNVGLCAGLEFGRMHAQGFGVDEPASREVFWLAFPFGASAIWHFGPSVGVRLALGAAVPFGRPDWVLDQIGTVDQPAVIAGRGALSLDFTL